MESDGHTGQVGSEENVEIVRRAGEVWLDSGIATMAAEFLAPGVEYEDDPSWPDHRTATGRKAVVERFEEWLEAWEGDLDATVERIAGADDRVVSIFVLRTQGTASGMHQSHRWGYVFDLEDGLIVRFRAYLDPAEAVKAAGLSE